MIVEQDFSSQGLKRVLSYLKHNLAQGEGKGDKVRMLRQFLMRLKGERG